MINLLKFQLKFSLVVIRIDSWGVLKCFQWENRHFLHGSYFYWNSQTVEIN